MRKSSFGVATVVVVAAAAVDAVVDVVDVIDVDVVVVSMSVVIGAVVVVPRFWRDG